MLNSISQTTKIIIAVLATICILIISYELYFFYFPPNRSLAFEQAINEKNFTAIDKSTASPVYYTRDILKTVKFPCCNYISKEELLARFNGDEKLSIYNFAQNQEDIISCKSKFDDLADLILGLGLDNSIFGYRLNENYLVDKMYYADDFTELMLIE